jgi:hypothetical protein
MRTSPRAASCCRPYAVPPTPTPASRSSFTAAPSQAGGAATTVATWAGWDDGPTDLAVDESGVYWAVNSQSRVSASVMGLAIK